MSATVFLKFRSSSASTVAQVLVISRSASYQRTISSNTANAQLNFSFNSASFQLQFSYISANYPLTRTYSPAAMLMFGNEVYVAVKQVRCKAAPSRYASCCIQVRTVTATATRYSVGSHVSRRSRMCTRAYVLARICVCAYVLASICVCAFVGCAFV